MVDGQFQPGFICYGIPVGSDAYVRHTLCDKARKVERDVTKVVDTLTKDNQALWVALHRSHAHKMDYHLALCYPSDILPVAQRFDAILWSALESATGQHIPRREEGLGIECVLDIPVDNMTDRSFQDHFLRLPIRLRGFGLRSLVETSAAAFIGGVEMAFGGPGSRGGLVAHIVGLWEQNWGGIQLVLVLPEERRGTNGSLPQYRAFWRSLDWTWGGRQPE